MFSEVRRISPAGNWVVQSVWSSMWSRIHGAIHLNMKVDGPLNKFELRLRDAIWIICNIRWLLPSRFDDWWVAIISASNVDIHPVLFKPGNYHNEGRGQVSGTIRNFLKSPRILIEPLSRWSVPGGFDHASHNEKNNRIAVWRASRTCRPLPLFLPGTITA